ncbi:MAG: tRNA (uridine(34)/cytosine(34)/5-carboxymethylaminomethyluridine(34)-2'-O)-methyltransferase TrmL [Eubacteriales bacterium]|nr:tRNA (uridine(34)/cytosine(34)/5-carboxymethylaminomethyluridine(34)-2'-O)-methyltransferase TrmL [Eubacteriales bacterium]
MAMLGIVLVEPEIPQNTGNIARTCAVTGCTLHLVGPLGFEISDKRLKRAGLDYWHLLDVRYYDSLAEFWEKNPDGTYFYATSKGQQRHTDVTYPPDAYLLFGRETKGLPADMLREHPERCVRIPMREGARCLNLSNSVAVVVYEALRQNDFADLCSAGPFPEV